MEGEVVISGVGVWGFGLRNKGRSQGNLSVRIVFRGGGGELGAGLRSRKVGAVVLGDGAVHAAVLRVGGLA